MPSSHKQPNYVYAGLIGWCVSYRNDHASNVELVARFKDMKQYDDLAADGFQTCEDIFDAGLQANAIQVRLYLQQYCPKLATEHLLNFDFSDYRLVGSLKCESIVARRLDVGRHHHIDVSSV